MAKIKITIGIALVISLLVLAGCTTPTGNATSNVDKITVYKSASCGCCVGYIAELEKSGYNVEAKSVDNLASIKQEHNIPQNMQSCHTAVVGAYFIEGHVPMQAVKKMLEEKPDIDGIALPNMPAGTPGMPGTKTETWTIYGLKDGKKTVYMEI